jgi:leader peptidase (prepilin peptidase)/N-methyltransferase
MYFEIAILAVLLIASLIDFKKKEIAYWEILGCAGISAARVFWQLRELSPDPLEIMISLLPGVVMLLVAFLSREGIGYGDGLLALSIGPGLGAEVMLYGICGALFLSSVISGILLVLRKAGRNTRIPFVPFMTLGVGVMMFAPL